MVAVQPSNHSREWMETTCSWLSRRRSDPPRLARPMCALLRPIHHVWAEIAGAVGSWATALPYTRNPHARRLSFPLFSRTRERRTMATRLEASLLTRLSFTSAKVSSARSSTFSDSENGAAADRFS
jgi:hypothetical protein